MAADITTTITIETPFGTMGKWMKEAEPHLRHLLDRLYHGAGFVEHAEAHLVRIVSGPKVYTYHPEVGFITTSVDDYEEATA